MMSPVMNSGLISQLRLVSGGDLEDHVPAHVGNAEVDEHDVDVLAANDCERASPDCAAMHVIAGARQRHRQRLADRRFVVDDEYARRALAVRHRILRLRLRDSRFRSLCRSVRRVRPSTSFLPLSCAAPAPRAGRRVLPGLLRAAPAPSSLPGQLAQLLRQLPRRVVPCLCRHVLDRSSWVLQERIRT